MCGGHGHHDDECCGVCWFSDCITCDVRSVVVVFITVISAVVFVVLVTVLSVMLGVW